MADSKAKTATVAKAADTAKVVAKADTKQSPAPEKAAAPAVKKYKLKDPTKQYAEGPFTLAGTQEKELPKYPSAELRKRIKAGFIVEVK